MGGQDRLESRVMSRETAFRMIEKVWSHTIQLRTAREPAVSEQRDKRGIWWRSLSETSICS